MIDSMGFDDWAFNWLVNEIENGNLRDGYRHEEDNGSIVINKIDMGTFNIAIRAYHADRGWLSVEFTYKLPSHLQ